MKFDPATQLPKLPKHHVWHVRKGGTGGYSGGPIYRVQIKYQIVGPIGVVRAEAYTVERGYTGGYDDDIAIVTAALAAYSDLRALLRARKLRGLYPSKTLED